MAVSKYQDFNTPPGWHATLPVRKIQLHIEGSQPAKYAIIGANMSGVVDGKGNALLQPGFADQFPGGPKQQDTGFLLNDAWWEHNPGNGALSLSAVDPKLDKTLQSNDRQASGAGIHRAGMATHAFATTQDIQ